TCTHRRTTRWRTCSIRRRRPRWPTTMRLSTRSTPQRSWSPERAVRSRAQILITALSIAALPPQPPAIVHAGGAFAATRLAQPPAIDGREWIATSAAPVSKPGKVTVNAKTLALTARDCGGDHGDFERCQLLLRRGGQAVRIGAGWTGWVFVTP